MDGGPREDTAVLLQRRLDDVTRLLCEMCGKAENIKGGKKLFSPELSKWWEKHQEQDRARIRAEQERKKREKVREGAIAKLSAEERKALNLPTPFGQRPKKRGG